MSDICNGCGATIDRSGVGRCICSTEMLREKLTTSEAEREKAERQNAELAAALDAMWRKFCSCESKPGDCFACRIASCGAKILAATSAEKDKHIVGLAAALDNLQAAARDILIWWAINAPVILHPQDHRLFNHLDTAIGDSPAAILTAHDAAKDERITKLAAALEMERNRYAVIREFLLTEQQWDDFRGEMLGDSQSERNFVKLSKWLEEHPGDEVDVEQALAAHAATVTELLVDLLREWLELAEHLNLSTQHHRDRTRAALAPYQKKGTQ